MPFYEYECVKCGDSFEFLHLGRDEVVRCEKCGTKKVKRIPSSFGFGFKGFGAAERPAPEIPSAENESETAGGCGCSDGGCGCG